MSLSEMWDEMEVGLASMCHQYDMELNMVPMGESCVVSLTEEDDEEASSEYTLKWNDELNLMEIHGMYPGKVVKITAIPAAIFGVRRSPLV